MGSKGRTRILRLPIDLRIKTQILTCCEAERGLGPPTAQPALLFSPLALCTQPRWPLVPQTSPFCLRAPLHWNAPIPSHCPPNPTSPSDPTQTLLPQKASVTPLKLVFMSLMYIFISFSFNVLTHLHCLVASGFT